MLVASLLATAFLLPLPYHVHSAGVVRATEPLISVEGGHGYPSKTQIMFLTVSEQQATPALLLWAWLDSTVDAEKDPDHPAQTDQQEQVVNKKAMEESKLDALYVAYKKLGYSVEIHGTGAFIAAMLPDLPAAKVFSQGDVITAIDGHPVQLADDVRPLLVDKPIGATVEVSVRRHADGTTKVASIKLGRNSNDPSHGFLGVSLETADQTPTFPFSTKIDSGDVVGPSAGLAFTLGVIDRLTPGDLAGNRKIAVTGEIALDGTVGNIGGIAQKIVGAKEAGATEFLYPAGTPADEVARVRKIAGKSISLHPVATLDDALKVIAPGGIPAAAH